MQLYITMSYIYFNNFSSHFCRVNKDTLCIVFFVFFRLKNNYNTDSTSVSSNIISNSNHFVYCPLCIVLCVQYFVCIF